MSENSTFEKTHLFSEDAIIAVVVPTFHAHAYLAECLESIRLQTYHNIEVYVVDNNENDSSESREIIDDFCAKDLRFHYSYCARRGPSAARNFGIKQIPSIQNKWVTFIDSDDWVEPDYLKTMIDICRAKRRYAVFFAWRKQRGGNIIPLDDHNLFTGTSLIPLFLTNEVAIGAPYKLLAGFLVARHAFDERAIIGEDLLFNLDIACDLADNTIALLFQPFGYHYRTNDASLTHSSNWQEMNVNQLYVGCAAWCHLMNAEVRFDEKLLIQDIVSHFLATSPKQHQLTKQYYDIYVFSVDVIRKYRLLRKYRPVSLRNMLRTLLMAAMVDLHIIGPRNYANPKSR